MIRPTSVSRWLRSIFRGRPLNRKARRAGLGMESLERRDVPSSTAINTATRLLSPGIVNAGFDAFTGSLFRSIDDTLGGGLGRLPLVGDRIRDAADPVIASFKAANSSLQTSVNALYAGTQTDIIAGIRNGLFSAFGPSGVNLLQDSDNASGISVNDVVRTGATTLSATDPFSQLNLRLGGSYHVDVPLDLALSSEILTGLPGMDFSLAANNGVRIQFDWTAYLGVGFDLNTPYGFYFVSESMNEYGQSAEEFSATLSVFAAPPKNAAGQDLPADGPGLAASVSLGFLSASASDGITEGLSVSAEGPLQTFTTGATTKSFNLQFTYEHSDTIKTSPVYTINASNAAGTAGLAAAFNTDLQADIPDNLFDHASLVPFYIYPDYTANDDPSLTNNKFRWVLKANDPDILSITITNGNGIGFGVGGAQYEDQRSTTLGFVEASPVLNALAAAFAAPASGQLARDVDFTLVVGTANVPIRIFADDVNESIVQLAGTPTTGQSLQQVLQAEVNAAVARAGVANTFTVTLSSNTFVITRATGANVNLSVIAPDKLTSRASVTLAVDLADDSEAGGVAGRISFKDLYSAGGDALGTLILPSARAEADLRLHVNAGGNTGTVGVGLANDLGGGISGITLGLPGITFDFFVNAVADYRYDDDGKLTPSFEYSDPHFHNLLLDPGSLLSSVIKPVAGTLNKVLGPINQLIGSSSGLLNESIPVIDRVLGQTLTINSMLNTLGFGQLTSYVNGFLQIPAYISNLITNFNDAIDNGRKINMGNWYYKGAFLPEAYGLVADSLSSLSLEAFNKTLNLATSSPGLSVDILQPINALKLISGNTFDLVSFSLGSVNFNANIGTSSINTTFGVPNIAEVGFNLGGSVNIGFNLPELSIRYDSTGLERMAAEVRAGQLPDLKHLYEGIYLDLQNGSKVDINGGFSGSGGAKADFLGSNVVDFQVSFNGKLNGFVELIDPTGDDEKIYLNEIFALTNNFSQPSKLISLFDFGVGFSGGFSIDKAYFVGINVDNVLDDIGIPTSFTVGADLSLSDVFGSTNKNTFPTTPTLAVKNGGVLTINSGPRAALRLAGDTSSTTGDNFSISNSGSTVTVTYTNSSGAVSTQSFTGISSVVMPGGTGNDILNAGALSLPVTITSGGGNDTITGGSGNDTLDGSTGVNVTITGGGGKDVITGGSGSATITVSSTSPTTIYAGTGKNTITLSGSGHTVYTDKGSPTISGGIANTYNLGTGSAIVTPGNGANTIIDGTGGHTINFSNSTTPIDFTTAGGNDTVIGTAFADTLRAGGFGNVTFQGGGGNDTLIGGPGDDLLDGGADNDTLTGGGGLDTYNLGAGDNTVHIGIGAARFTSVNGSVNNNGGTGSDTIHGADASQGFTYNANGGADTVYGSAFDDILTSGTGTGKLYGNLGTNTLRGVLTDLLPNGPTISGTPSEIAIQGGNSNEHFILDISNLTTVTATTPGLVVLFDGTTTTNFKYRTGDTIQINATGVANAIAVTANNITGNLIFNTGAGADTFSVQNVTGNVTINAGEGLNILGTGAAGSYPFQNITGAVSLTGGNAKADNFNVTNITGPLTITDIGGNGNVVTAANISGLTTITTSVGSDTVTLDTINGSEIFTGDGSKENSVTITNASGHNTINGGTAVDTITVNSSTGTFAITPAGGNDHVTLTGVSGASTILLEGSDTISLNTVSGAVTLNSGTGTGNTTVNVNGLTAASTFNFLPNTDSTQSSTVKLTNLTKSLTINGGATGSKNVIVTRAHLDTPRTYTFAATSLATAGQGKITFSNLSKLQVNAGTGADAASITGNGNVWPTTFDAGPGDDTVSASTVFNGTTTQFFTVVGNTGTDTVTASIPTATPVVASKDGSPFQNLAFNTVEQLVIDNNAFAGEITWSFTDRSLVASAVLNDIYPLINTEGATNVRLIAGTNSQNLLRIKDNSANRQTISVGGSIVRLQDNPNVLVPATAKFVAVESIVPGLAFYENSSVTISSTGTVFATSIFDSSLFSTSANIAVSTPQPGEIHSVDLDNDGDFDLVAALSGGSESQARLFFNAGDGTFSKTADITVTTVNGEPENVRSGDFNNDGKVDLAFSNFQARTVSILTGNGNGTFNPFTSIATVNSALPQDLEVADLDGDGNLDFVVDLGVPANPDGFQISRGKGNGTFHPTTFQYGSFVGITDIAIGDFNEDGRPDIAFTEGSNLRVFRNDGTLIGNDIVFTSMSSVAIGDTGGDITVADVNGDGNLDAVVGVSPGITTFLGNGLGSFPTSQYDSNAGNDRVAIADFDRDGVLDYLGSQATGTINFSAGVGNASFVAPVISSFTGSVVPSSFVIRDFNGDTLPDVAFHNTTSVTIFLNQNSNVLVTNPDSASASVARLGRATREAVPSADGKFLYTITDQGRLRVRNLATQAIDISTTTELGSGDKIIASPDNQTIYVLSSTQGLIRPYDRNTTTGTLSPSTTTSQSDALSMAFFGSHAYVITTNGSVIRFNRNATTGALSGAISLTNGSGGIVGMSAPKFISVSSDGAYVYVASTNLNANDLTSGIAVFSRNATTGNLAFVEFVRNGSEGVSGLRTIDGMVSKTIDGQHFVFAIGIDDNSLVALRHDPINGRLLPYQQLIEGVAGITGLETPNGIALHGNSISVTSFGGGLSNVDGGTARFDLATLLPAPTGYDFGFAGTLQTLSIETGNGDDSINTAPLTGALTFLGITTLGGSDVVTVTNTGSTSTNITTGDGSDTVSVANIGTGGFTASLGNGNDIFTLSAATASAGQITIAGGAGEDQFTIRGARVNRPVTLQGNSVSGFQDGFDDVLTFDAGANTITPASPTTPNGSVTVTGSLNVVTYTDIQTVSKVAGVLVNVAGPASIAEGGSATFTATTTPPDAGSAFIYEWDLDGDDVYDDATGASITPSWATLVAAGINDDGTYPVQVRVTQPATGIQSFGSRTLTVTDTLPTLAIPVAPATTLTPYSLVLSANEPSPTDTISKWTVNWGDGTTDEYLAAAPTAVHEYDLRGTYTITVTAVHVEDDGTTRTTTETRTQSVTYNTLEVIAGTTAAEGSQYTLNLNWEGLAIQFWYVTWVTGGPTQTYLPTTKSATFTYNASGTYTPSVQARYFNTGTSGSVTTENVIAPTVTVAEVGPTATISGPSTIAESGTYTLALNGAAFPTAGSGGTDTFSNWVVTWGDGTAPQTVAGNLASVTHVYADEGQYTISAVGYENAPNSASNTLSNLVSVNVTDVAPTLILTPSTSTFDEGGKLSLQYKITPSFPSVNDTVTAVTFNWGDGSTTTITNPAANSTVTLANAKQYNVPGVYTVTATTTTVGGTRQQAASILVTVNDVAPTISMSGAGTVAEGSPYTLSLNHIAQTADPVLGWTILWGDGITQQIAAEADGSTAITHVFADNGPATITAALRTTVGTYPVATSIPVTITAVAPIITVTPSATTIDEGSGLTIDIDAFNQGTGVITKYEVKWGDGSSNTFTDGSTSFSHVYANNGNFNVTVTATDNANKTSNIATNAVTVDDVLPTIVFLSNPVVYEDASYELRFRVVDPGVLDPAITQVRINYGDGTGGQNYNLTPANYTLNPATGFFEAKFIRSFANPGSFTVSVRTSQPVQGQFFSQTATVLSAPPVLAATAKVSGVAGNEWNVGTTANFELGLSYAAGTPSLSKWVINWGDGTAVQTVTTTSTSISVPHTYASTLALGDRYIVATATDATGDYSVGQLVRVINNATPTTGAIGGPVQLITGETGTFTLTNVVDSPADLATMKYSFALSAAGLAANYAAAQSTNSFTHQPGAAGPVTVYARAYDSSGSISTTKTIAVNVFTPPTVGSITINAGNSQRSRVTQIVVNLAEPITLNPTTFSGLGAVTLVRTSGGLPATVQTGATGPSGRITVAPLSGTTSTLSLTFDNADGSGITTGVESGSLADGRWQLNIPLLGYTSPLNAIHRLFGDADANSTVDGSDFATFGNAFGGSSVAFDFDNNGTIDGSDLIQFGNRFGLTL